MFNSLLSINVIAFTLYYCPLYCLSADYLYLDCEGKEFDRLGGGGGGRHHQGSAVSVPARPQQLARPSQCQLHQMTSNTLRHTFGLYLFCLDTFSLMTTSKTYRSSFKCIFTQFCSNHFYHKSHHLIICVLK